jgi:hypothetical protein
MSSMWLNGTWFSSSSGLTNPPVAAYLWSRSWPTQWNQCKYYINTKIVEKNSCCWMYWM